MRKYLPNALIAFFSALLAVFVYHNYIQKEVTPVIYEVQKENAPMRNVSFASGASSPLHGDFTVAAAKATKSVVNINVIKSVKNTNVLQTKVAGFPDTYDHNKTTTKESVSGSGVLITSNGYIVTSAHVVENAELIEVNLKSGRQFFAKMVGIDLNTDIALMKINGTDLPFIEFANSDKVRVGEWVLAVGNPYDLSSTVTAGIISATDRTLDLFDGYVESFIQSDAAVNQGNSGGALVNIHGYLLGINSAIATSSGSFEGFSFAIPSNIVKKIVEDLQELGYVRRPYLGIEIRDLNPADDGKISSYDGIRVVNVISNAAKKAGLKVNDIIVKVEGYQTKSFQEMQDILSQVDFGGEISITYLRNNKRMYTKLNLKEVENNSVSKEVESLLGAKIKQLTAFELKRYGLSNGLQIIELENGMLHKNTDIKRNLIITEVNNKTVASLEQLHEILFKIKDRRAVTIIGVYPGNNELKYFSFGMRK